MSRAIFNRMLLAVHGQSDELETPHCNAGCYPNDCECANDVPPDADRTFGPAPLPQDVRSRVVRRALYLSALLFGVLAGLLEAFGAEDMPRLLP